MRLKPLNDHLVVKPREKKQQTKGGLYLPDTGGEKRQNTGKVIAVGRGRVLEDGSIYPLDIKEGDRIVFSKYSGDEIKVADEKFLILKESDILGVLTTDREIELK